MSTEAHDYLSDTVKILLLVICRNAIIMGYKCQYSLLCGWI